MNNTLPAECFAPSEFILDEMRERFWTEQDLAIAIQRHKSKGLCTSCYDKKRK